MSDSLFSVFEWLTFGGLLLSPFYLATFTMIAWIIYRSRGETGGFLSWLLPSQVFLTRSTGVDVSLFVMGQLIQFFGLFARFAAVPAVAAYVAGLMPAAPLSDIALSPVGLAVLYFIVGDFSLYWAHRAHHTIKIIWPFHAVHHSAEVLSPITAYRQHPISGLINTCINTFVIGGLLGVLVGAFNPNATIWAIAGINGVVLVVNMTLTNFHHSHIWISFGPVLERLVISPAQHQVHHSTNPAHFNKNFGQSLAVWDWMFGTLYVTRHDERVTFGLKDKADAPLMTHRLWPILWDPVRRVCALAIGRS
jgi:sterol desaturase/sphingolipid hydroxylase (fatty acid hydroxylase superfamily)